MTRRTIGALGLFAGLLGLALYVRSVPEKGDRRANRPGAFAPIPAADIAKVTVKSEGQGIVLKRADGDNFRVVDPLDYPADAYAAKTLIEKLSKITFDDAITDRPEKHAEFEVDDAKGAHVTVEDKSGKVRADFVVGKYLNGTTLMRAAKSNQVFQAVGSLKHVFAKDLRGWRDKVVLDFKREEAQRLQVETSAGTIALKKKDEATWEVESSPATIPNLDQAMPGQIVTALAALRANDFADGAGADEAGLDKPTARITVTLKDGKTHALLIGASKGDDFFARPPDGRQVFLLRKNTVERVARRPIEFRDKTVLSFKADDALEVRITKGKSAVTLVRQGGAWTTRPAIEFDAQRVQNLVSTLANLKASTLSGDAVAGRPSGDVAVRLKDGTRAALRIGPLVGDNNYYVQREGRDDAFLVSKYVVDRFLLDAEGLKQPARQPGMPPGTPPRMPPGMPPGMPSR